MTDFDLVIQQVNSILEVASPGPQGTQGPQGPAGAAFQYVFNQPSPTSTWTINHNLNGYPNVTVVDSAGDVCYGNVQYVSSNQVVVVFSAAFSGSAYLS